MWHEWEHIRWQYPLRFWCGVGNHQVLRRSQVYHESSKLQPTLVGLKQHRTSTQGIPRTNFWCKLQNQRPRPSVELIDRHSYFGFQENHLFSSPFDYQAWSFTIVLKYLRPTWTNSSYNHRSKDVHAEVVAEIDRLGWTTRQTTSTRVA